MSQYIKENYYRFYHTLFGYQISFKAEYLLNSYFRKKSRILRVGYFVLQRLKNLNFYLECLFPCLTCSQNATNCNLCVDPIRIAPNCICPPGKIDLGEDLCRGIF